MKITKKSSPNYSAGRGGKKIDRIVIHWIVGTQASCDAIFARASSQVSAHYSIEDTKVHQYVKNTDTAWHAGNYDMNQRSIGIEHSADPSRPPSAQTNETSAQLVASLCKQYGIACNRSNIIKHSQVVPTQCCGSVPIDAIVKRAAEILGGKAPAPKPSPAPAPKPNNYTIINWGGNVTTKDVVNIRTKPTTAGNTPVKTNPKGALITIVGYTYGQNVNGSNIWLKTWNGYWVHSAATTFKRAATPAKPTSGTVVITAPVLHVRSAPRANAPLAGSQKLYQGNQVQFVGVVSGQNISQLGVTSDKWYKSIHGNYYWSGGTNKPR